MTRVQINLVIGWVIVIVLAASVVLFLLGVTAGIITLAHWITAE
jgi:hypothetical protein